MTDDVARDWTQDRWMACPRCGKDTRPYGGFAGAGSFEMVGKYSCCVGWYANPSSGEFYVRTGGSLPPLRVAPMAEAVWSYGRN